MDQREPVAAKQTWQKPTMLSLGSVEEVTQIKNAGGFDGVEIQLSNGDIITGS
jgi:hypothetical protein